MLDIKVKRILKDTIKDIVGAYLKDHYEEINILGIEYATTTGDVEVIVNGDSPKFNKDFKHYTVDKKNVVFGVDASKLIYNAVGLEDCCHCVLLEDSILVIYEG